MLTVIAYIVTLLLSVSGLLTLLNLPFLALGGRFRIDYRICMFLGSIFGWSLVGLAWREFEGGRVPIAALTTSMSTIWLHHRFEEARLLYTAKQQMYAEFWAIAVVVLLLLLNPPVRWL